MMRATGDENPYFDHAERAPVELGQLLLQLPRYGSQIGRGDKAGVQCADAAVRHAENAKATLLYGLESLGKCLFVANTGDGYRMNENEMANMGCFIQHIAVELQMLDGVIEEFRDVAKEGL